MTSLIIHPLTSTPSLAEKKDEQEAAVAGSSFLEMLNPLQYIPGVSQLYRGATGTDIPALAKVVGGGVVGGVVGAVSAAAVGAVEAISGQPMLEMAQDILEKPVDYQPVTRATHTAHALQPDNGESYLSLLETMANPSSAPATQVPIPTPTPTIRELEALRQSAVGLPQESIEAQLHHQLHKETVSLL